MNLASEIANCKVPESSVRLWWIGQAGFVFKTGTGFTVTVDPYLSNAVERLHGFKRLSLPAIGAEELKTDLVAISHEHDDHFDPDAIPVIARNNPACRFAGTSACQKRLQAAGIGPARRLPIVPGRVCKAGGVKIHAVPADHGEFAPTAVSVVLDFGKVRILFTGDTAFRSAAFKPLYDLAPDVLLPCINGGFGNMTPVDAARMASQAKPRYAIPCHFWTFAEQGVQDPAGFLHACKVFCPDVKALLLRPGEGFTVNPKK